MKNVFLIAFIFLGTSLFAQEDINVQKKYGAQGYDLISYFDGEATKGEREHVIAYKGVKYLFSTKLNAEKFQNTPENFLPEYGGWCAYAMADKGKKVGINPETFEIRDGKLYLFYNKLFTNTLESWIEEGAEDLRAQADQNWEEVKFK